MVHKRVLELVETFAQCVQVDLSEMFSYFALVLSFIIHQKFLLTLFDQIRRDGRHGVSNPGFFPQKDLPSLTGLSSSLGGGTHLTSEGDPEGLLHIIDAGMR